jgi:hypothetical protein
VEIDDRGEKMMAGLWFETAVGISALLAISGSTEPETPAQSTAAEPTTSTVEYSPPAGWSAHCTLAPAGDMDEAAQGATNPVVRELLLRVATEQRCMKSMRGATQDQQRQTTEVLRQMVEANTVWLKSKLLDHPLFSIAYSGPKGSTAAWLIVQHSDHDTAWQREILALLRPLVDAQDFRPANYALMLDRVAVNAGELQTYGSQGRCEGAGNWQPRAMIDPANVDVRRTTMGLPPMAEYRTYFTCQ